MDAVESFLLCVVGISVLMFLILDHFDSFGKSGRACVRVYDSKKEVRVEEQRSVVRGDCEAEEEEVPENFRKIAEEEEKEKAGSAGCTELGVSVDDCCGDLRVSEGDEIGGEEGFIDDWEGIERTELERAFGEAVVFVNSKCNGDEISGDVKSELYGLQKVALEGPCCGSQPMTFNFSARSKWNAWQKLGDMSRETAMENYIEILSEAIPKWKGEDNSTIQDSATLEDLTPTRQSKHEIEVER